MSRITGVDVSDYQPNWKPAPSDDFCIIKASEGKSWRSDSIKAQAAAARSKGLVVGYYHFLWPSSQSGSPAVQADWFLKCIPDLRPGEILACDWEGTNGGTASQADKDQFLHSLLDRAGGEHRIGLYVNCSMWAASNKYKADFLWLADPGTSPCVGGWTFWQFDWEPIDTNYAAFSSRAELRAWSRTAPFLPAAPEVGDGLFGMTKQIYQHRTTDQ